MLHALNPSTLERQAELIEFEASLFYRASSRIARPIQRNHLSKVKKKNKEIIGFSFSK